MRPTAISFARGIAAWLISIVALKSCEWTLAQILAGYRLSDVDLQTLIALLSIVLTFLFYRASQQYFAGKPGLNQNVAVRQKKATDYLLLVFIAFTIPVVVAVLNRNMQWTFTFTRVDLSLTLSSLLILFSLAFQEEFYYRFAFIEFAQARTRVAVIASLIVQTFLFVLLHGKVARVSVDSLLWYAVPGYLLGCLYYLYRSIYLCACIHLVLNVEIAQIEPTRHWFISRIIDYPPGLWTEFSNLSFILLSILATLRIMKRWGEAGGRPTPEIKNASALT